MTDSEPTDLAPRPAGRAPRVRRSVLIGLGIFLLALVLRMTHLMQLVRTEFFDERPFVVDARYYDMRASEIAHGDLFGDAPAYLSPLYCHALGLVYTLPGFGLALGKLIQALTGAASALLLYLIGRRLFGELAGVLAGLAASVYGLFIFYTGLLLPTTLILFLYLLLVWLLVAGPPGRWRMFGSGILIGLAIGAKANAILLLPVLAGWLLYNHRETRLGTRFGWVALMSLGAFLSIAPITYGNWKTSGEFVLASTTGGRNLLKGNGPTANGTHVDIDVKRRTSTLGTYLAGKARPLAAVREDHRLRKQAVEYILENPGRTARLWFRKLLLFFNQVELGIRDSYPFARTQTPLLGGPLLGFGLLVPFGLAGLFLLSGRDRNTALLALVTATQVASFVIVFVLARYRVAAVGLLMVFAGGFVAQLLSWLARRDFQRLALGLFTVAASFALVHLPLEGVPTEPTTGEQLEYLGERAAHRGRYEDAIEYYERAMTATFAMYQRDSRWRVRERIGSCLLLMGRPEEARELWTGLYYEISEKAPQSSFEQADRLRTKLAELELLQH